VLGFDPQFIFIGASSWVNRPKAVRTGYDVAPESTRANLAPYAQRPGWPGLSAIRAGELHALEHGLARTLFDDTALLYMAKRFYPGAFEADDPGRVAGRLPCALPARFLLRHLDAPMAALSAAGAAARDGWRRLAARRAAMLAGGVAFLAVCVVLDAATGPRHAAAGRRGQIGSGSRRRPDGQRHPYGRSACRSR
jgi:hypothetical protein